MNFKIIFVILLAFAGCISSIKETDEQCEIDFEFRSNFQNCIEIMALRQQGYSIDFEHTARAYRCLEVLTGYKSYMNTDSDTPLFYPHSEDNLFLKDLKAWSQWYEQNKCIMSINKSDSIFSYHTSQYDTISWPRFLLKYVTTDSAYSYFVNPGKLDE